MIDILISVLIGVAAVISALMAIEEKRASRSLLFFVFFAVCLTGFMIHSRLLALALMTLALSLGSFAFIAVLYSLSSEEKDYKRVRGAVVAVILAIALFTAIGRIGSLSQPPETILGLHESAIPLILAHGIFILALALSLRVIMKEGERA
ncbi:MAG: hypothetical protein DRJ52_06910 [Thermoprotei archaeon]|nr:MAG: hypothetical protein DRJ52_06910 [Thermoprotei archaeon]RLE99905.1 MAG: hypothetical protein DRJ63_03900 [Thermoprotei archaeon]HDI75569.1 hypothetical protein [Thermoprotei archaeon]